MTTYLLDTNVVVEVLRGDTALQDALQEQIGARSRLAICCVTVAELEFGMRPIQRRRADHLVSRFWYLPTTQEAATRAGRYMALSRKRGRSLQLGDALIAGTARAHGATLVTGDVKDFTMRDIRVLRPDELPDQP